MADQDMDHANPDSARSVTMTSANSFAPLLASSLSCCASLPSRQASFCSIASSSLPTSPTAISRDSSDGGQPFLIGSHQLSVTWPNSSSVTSFVTELTPSTSDVMSLASFLNPASTLFAQPAAMLQRPCDMVSHAGGSQALGHAAFAPAGNFIHNTAGSPSSRTFAPFPSVDSPSASFRSHAANSNLPFIPNSCHNAPSSGVNFPGPSSSSTSSLDSFLVSPNVSSCDSFSQPLATSSNSKDLPSLRNYECKKLLHKSLFGRVYAGYDRHRQLPVAIKRSYTAMLSQQTTRTGHVVAENPLDEAEILSQLPPHPNMVMFYESLWDKQSHWIVSEYVDGGDLFELVSSSGGLPEGHAKKLFRQIICGLHHLHKHSVCHLDLSLENVLMSSKGVPKICDFGAARVYEPNTCFTIAENEPRPGKLAYTAPEILDGEFFDGPKADIFSCGVMLFIVLTGSPPFESASMLDKRYELVVQGGVSQLLTALGLEHTMSTCCADLITKMLRPNPYQRPSTREIASHAWFSSSSSANASSSSSYSNVPCSTPIIAGPLC